MIISLEDPSLAKITQAHSENKIKLTISIPLHVDFAFKHQKLIIENKISKQKEIIYLTFYPNMTYDESESFLPSLGDMITVIIFILIAFIIYQYIIKQNVSQSRLY